MTRLIVWLTIEDKVASKKHKFNQFWIEAKDSKEASEAAMFEASKFNFVPKILGISAYENLSWEEKKLQKSRFENKTFH